MLEKKCEHKKDKTPSHRGINVYSFIVRPLLIQMNAHEKLHYSVAYENSFSPMQCPCLRRK